MMKFVLLAFIVLFGLASVAEAKIVEGTTYTDEQVWNMLQNYMQKSANEMDSGMFGLTNRKMHELLEGSTIYQQLKAQFDPAPAK